MNFYHSATIFNPKHLLRTSAYYIKRFKFTCTRDPKAYVSTIYGFFVLVLLTLSKHTYFSAFVCIQGICS